MTGIRDRSDLIRRWRATLDALEAIVLAPADQPEIDMAEANEVQRLITMRLAVARRNNLPAASARRPWIVARIVPDAGAMPETAEGAESTPRSPNRPSLLPPAWHE